MIRTLALVFLLFFAADLTAACGSRGSASKAKASVKSSSRPESFAQQQRPRATVQPAMSRPAAQQPAKSSEAGPRAAAAGGCGPGG